MDLRLDEQYGAESLGNEHRTFAPQIKLREIVPQRRPAVHWPRATGQVLLRAPVVREEHERAVGQFEQQAREALDLRAPLLSLQLLLDLARTTSSPLLQPVSKSSVLTLSFWTHVELGLRMMRELISRD